mmetsp:Transcript_95602/g.209065  ORF Transcript_95602/g.209065 Transcript_95602/m.209065 type:complete len:328 (-) Transcript_95602:73-1056(-)
MVFADSSSSVQIAHRDAWPSFTLATSSSDPNISNASRGQVERCSSWSKVGAVSSAGAQGAEAPPSPFAAAAAAAAARRRSTIANTSATVSAWIFLSSKCFATGQKVLDIRAEWTLSTAERGIRKISSSLEIGEQVVTHRPRPSSVEVLSAGCTNTPRSPAKDPRSAAGAAVEAQPDSTSGSPSRQQNWSIVAWIASNSSASWVQPVSLPCRATVHLAAKRALRTEEGHKLCRTPGRILLPKLAVSLSTSGGMNASSKSVSTKICMTFSVLDKLQEESAPICRSMIGRAKSKSCGSSDSGTTAGRTENPKLSSNVSFWCGRGSPALCQ